LTRKIVLLPRIIENNHRAPSSFQKAGGIEKSGFSFTVDKSKSSRGAESVFGTVDAIFKRFALGDDGPGQSGGEALPDPRAFTPAAFGIIAHGYVEALMSGATLRSWGPPDPGGRGRSVVRGY
jgi:hypothetical protein